MEAKKHPHFTHAVRGKKTTRIFHTLFDRKYGLFFALGGGAGEKIVDDFALAGTERVCVFCRLFTFCPAYSFQISVLYWRMVRSEEKKPAIAVFISIFLPHAALSL